MQISVQLILAGIVVFWIGVIVLLIGKRAEKSFNQVVGMGREIYDKLDEVFLRSNVLMFKLLASLGLLIVFAGIAAAIYEIVV